MKRITAVLLTAALLTLSACDTPVVEPEGSSEVASQIATDTSSQTASEASFSTSSSDSSLMYKSQKAKKAWEKDSSFTPNDELPWQAYPEKSDEWYLTKYIEPYMNGLGLAFGEPQELDGLNVFTLACKLVSNYIDIDDYYSSSVGSYILPREMLQETMRTFFNYEYTSYKDSTGYDSDLDAFLINYWNFALFREYTLVDVQEDGLNIILQVDVYRNGDKTFIKDNLVFTIRDNGNTFEYISVLFKNGKPSFSFSDITASDFEPLSDEWILSELLIPVETALNVARITKQSAPKINTEAIDFFVDHKFRKGCTVNRSFREGEYLMRPYFDLSIYKWAVPKDIYEDIVTFYFGDNIDFKEVGNFDEERQAYTFNDYLIDWARGDFTIKRVPLNENSIAVDLFYTEFSEDTASENSNEPQHVRTYVLEQVDNRYILQDVISPEETTSPAN